MGEGAKRLIDAEGLVCWAASNELPKARRKTGFVFPPLHLLRDGELVGKWNVPACYPEVSPMFSANVGGGSAAPLAYLGEPDPDALEVERTLRSIARNPPSIEGEIQLVAHNIGDDVAVAAAGRALRNARRSLAGLVLGHGALGTRPQWDHPPFATAPLRAERGGKPAVFRLGLISMPTLDGGMVTVEGEIRCEAKRRDEYPAGAYCRIEYDPDPHSVIADRADYLIWRSALAELARTLSGRLARFEPIEPAAPRAPWLNARRD